MELRTLETTSIDQIHRAFVDAFSDYVVPMKPVREQLLEMFTRRGWRPELSVGAFHDGELVGFAINALEGRRSYNSGTGVIPSQRRAHIGYDIMCRASDVLRRAGAREYVLEVIEANIAARRLYERAGFTATRHLQCWGYEASGGESFPTIETPDWDRMRAMWEIEPAWQNSIASLQRSRAQRVFLGDERGYAIVIPATGDVPQLAVAREHRRSGLGRRLLNAAAARAEKPLRIMNIDSADRGIATFLERCGAQRTIAQIEMKCEFAE